ncbi:Tyrosine recombinase XerC [subsurface metagenome]
MAKVYLELEDIEQLEAATTCMRDHLLIRLLFWSGCRISEALGITVEDVDPAQGITIKHLKARTRLLCPYCETRMSRAAKFCPGCGKEVPTPIRKEQEAHRQRTIPLDDETMKLLTRFINEDHTKGLIFKICRNHAWKIVKDCAERAGVGKLVNPETGEIRGVSPHRLRDAFATMAVLQDDSTDSIRSLQEQLGHASIATTMKYRKIAGKEQREWYQKIAGAK